MTSHPAVVPTARLVEALDRAGLLVEVIGELPATLSALTDDSRHVQPGGLFLAVKGAVADGHAFVPKARAAGAALVMLEDRAAVDGAALLVRDGRRAAARVAAAWYHEPARALRLVAATGTNGKTTTVGMLRHCLEQPDAPTASIGTLGVLAGSAGTVVPGGSGLTTPGPVELQRVLRLLVDRGVRTVAMETSSHALHQRRIEGVAFAAAVFTNLTRDHLDYHGTMEAYFAAKASLVSWLAPDGVAVVNADDPAWRELPAAPRQITFGLEQHADVQARDVQYSPEGTGFTLAAFGATAPVQLPLIGDFNVSNALAAAATGLAVGASLEAMAAALTSLPQVPGRLERLSRSPSVLRDYAHTPDALERALHAVRPFVAGRLVVVFGCGGDRDRGKRPVMGAIAERLADRAYVTSDNPRTEDPERILDDIEAGMTRRDHVRIEDRRAAIAAAIADAAPGDVILLAGKGHETYQIRGTESLPFDEAAIVAELTRPHLP
ncbi:MAG: UDP-N-acetylmuramoyl-L-alanyl-D-glutamate--2,6-diaminopimelate ligase [Gemmatimonadaceae bacterium]|nr:UDP-N-acetylmuramoyl-L-alanyl-D-glutamate--2,6-diaminopimelate ligase [Gemmatimonadaceae bacterium]